MLERITVPLSKVQMRELYQKLPRGSLPPNVKDKEKVKITLENLGIESVTYVGFNGRNANDGYVVQIPKNEIKKLNAILDDNNKINIEMLEQAEQAKIKLDNELKADFVTFKIISDQGEIKLISTPKEGESLGSYNLKDSFQNFVKNNLDGDILHPVMKLLNYKLAIIPATGIKKIIDTNFSIKEELESQEKQKQNVQHQKDLQDREKQNEQHQALQASGKQNVQHQKALHREKQPFEQRKDDVSKAITVLNEITGKNWQRFTGGDNSDGIRLALLEVDSYNEAQANNAIEPIKDSITNILKDASGLESVGEIKEQRGRGEKNLNFEITNQEVIKKISDVPESKILELNSNYKLQEYVRFIKLVKEIVDNPFWDDKGYRRFIPNTVPKGVKKLRDDLAKWDKDKKNLDKCEAMYNQLKNFGELKMNETVDHRDPLTQELYQNLFSDSAEVDLHELKFKITHPMINKPSGP